MSPYASSNPPRPPASRQVARLLLALRAECGAVLERNLLELLGVVDGNKQVVRLPVGEADWPALVECCSRLGLRVGRSPFKTATVRTTPLGDRFTINVPWDDPRGEGFIAYVARGDEVTRRAAATEGAGDDAATGALYEYPPCCSAAYAEIGAGGAYWVDALLRRTYGSRQSPFGNKLAYLFDGATLFPDYFPCSLSCGPTRRLGASYRNLLHRYGLGSLADSLFERLTRPVLVCAGAAHQIRGGRLEGGLFRFDPAAVRSFRWSGDAPDLPEPAGTIQVREDGPWLRAVRRGGEFGTLYLFDVGGE